MVREWQCCRLGGFPAQLGCFFRCVVGFFLLLWIALFWAIKLHALFWAIKLHAVFWAGFSEDFSIKEYTICQ